VAVDPCAVNGCRPAFAEEEEFSGSLLIESFFYPMKVISSGTVAVEADLLRCLSAVFFPVYDFYHIVLLSIDTLDFLKTCLLFFGLPA
jgi:hypothetical protein